jgi:hypothetical protein
MKTKYKKCSLSACPHWRTGNECHFSGKCVSYKLKTTLHNHASKHHHQKLLENGIASIEPKK